MHPVIAAADPAAIVVALVVFPVLLLLVYLAQPTCPSCRKRTRRWLHAKKGGGPDGRYRDNYELCSACGWTSRGLPETPSSPPRASGSARPARTVTGAGTPARPADVVRQQSLEANARAEAKARADAEEKARADADRKKRAPAYAFVWLAKFVATGDRRFSDNETLAIIQAVAEHFPSADLSRAEVEAIMEALTPSLAELPDMMAGIQVSAENVKGVVDLLRSISAADGKATKGELERLALVERGLLGSESSAPPP